jgi:predicted amidohydrolase
MERALSEVSRSAVSDEQGGYESMPAPFIYRVALLQADSCGPSLERSLKRGTSLCQEAARRGADLALFPEMWSVGYTIVDDDRSVRSDFALWRARAVTVESEFVLSFRRLACKLNMAIGLTILEDLRGAVRNSLVLISRAGEVVYVYAKVHLCEFGSEAGLTAGNDFYVAELQGGEGSVRVGAMICYDREFPESARVLALQGAEIILVPNACYFDEARNAQLRTRAFENMAGVVMANYSCGRIDRPWPFRGSNAMNGHSVAYSPIVVDDEDSPVDPLIVLAGAVEGIHVAEFDISAQRRYSSHQIWGSNFRRPACYASISAP